MRFKRLLVLVAVFVTFAALLYGAKPPALDIVNQPYVVAVSDELVDTTQFAKSEPPYTIGFVTIFQANSWAVQFTHELLVEAERLSDLVARVIHLDAQGEIPKQIAAVEDLIAQKVDAIVIDPISPTALQGVLKRAQQAGIPVIACSSQIPLDQVTAWVGRDDVDFGRKTAEWLVQKLNGKGKIIALSGIAGNPVAENRWKGAKEVFDKYPEIKILAREFADWGYAQAKDVVSNLLAAYPEIDGVWSGGGAMTRGAIDAFIAAGRKLPPMVGEANNGFMKQWYNLKPQGFESIAFTNPTNHTAIGLRLALNALMGYPIPKTVTAVGPYITNDTLEDYVRLDLPDEYWAGNNLPEEVIKEIFGVK